MIRSIVFDFAGVVATEGYTRWLKRYVPGSGRDMKHFLEIAEIGDRGLDVEKYLSLLAQESGIPRQDLWITMRKEFIIDSGILDLIKILKKKYKIGLLSNFTSNWLEGILLEEDMNKYFDAVTISSEVHVVKPEPEIFNDMCKKLQLEPQEIIFIDDKPENVEGAKAFGMASILFTGIEKLKTDLIKLGII